MSSGSIDSMENNKASTTSAKEEIKDPRVLSSVYKRRGLFDKKRRELQENFANDDSNERLDELLIKLIDIKIEKDPSLLIKNKGKISALIQASLVNITENKQQWARNSREGRSSYSLKNNIGPSRSDKEQADGEDEIIQKIHALLVNYAEKNTTQSKPFEQILTEQLKELKSSLENEET